MATKARDVFLDIVRSASRCLPAVAFVGALSIHAPANAIPIGDFNWTEHTAEECDAGLCGALFSVDNFSDADFSLGLPGDSFFGVLVNLQTDTGALSVSLGDIAAGGSGQSIDPLADLVINSAVLQFIFGAPELPGSIQFLDEAGAVVAALTAPGSLLIDFTARVEPPPVPVPEPSTLLLIVGGLVGFVRYGKRKLEGKIDAKDRDRVSAA